LTPQLQLIFLLNNNPDTPGYAGDMKRLIGEINQSVPNAANRVGFFTLWSHEKNQIIPNYIHSKVAVIDDRWATIGSANLDTAGLKRSVEVNVVMFNGVDGGSVNDSPGTLRRTLWAEHLGFRNPDGSINPAAAELASRTNPDWFTLWKTRTNDKIDQLIKDPATPATVRVLPFSFETNPKKYLEALKVPTDKIICLDKVSAFSFESGKWLD
jgi:phosphatidylserine/phosphatidylglycerophosphate/cardiolipin synthase-like enzyme